MKYRALGNTGFNIVPLVFGCNVFGWTLDEKQSFKMLDAISESGLNAIDTADAYSTWVEGNKGGESETIIGNWLKQNPSKRDKFYIFTKVGSDMGIAGHKGLSARWIEQAVEDSLRRLHVEFIDLYQSHWFDPETPFEETLEAYSKLLKAGKIRAIGCSNITAEQLEQAMIVAKNNNLPSYQTLQPEYNLYDRNTFEGSLADTARKYGLGVITYYSLASGFLSGKYRSKEDLAGHKRGSRVEKYLNPRGMRILDALDTISEKHNAKQAEIALAWLIAKPAVTAPIASATKIDQLSSLVKAVTINLNNEDIEILDQASRY
ncbi:aldo/keto reductase [Bartonella choladocola]|nr:aldo/keto reductase [Bartonella choladocola]